MGESHLLSVVVEAEVAQHHDAAEQQGGGVCLVLPRDVGGCPVHRLHQRQSVGTCSMVTFENSETQTVCVLFTCHCQGVTATFSSVYVDTMQRCPPPIPLLISTIYSYFGNQAALYPPAYFMLSISNYSSMCRTCFMIMMYQDNDVPFHRQESVINGAEEVEEGCYQCFRWG